MGVCYIAINNRKWGMVLTICVHLNFWIEWQKGKYLLANVFLMWSLITITQRVQHLWTYSISISFMVSVQRVSFSFLFYSDILSSGIYLFHMAEKEHISCWRKGERIYDLHNTRSCSSFLIALQETDVTIVTCCQGEWEEF